MILHALVRCMWCVCVCVCVFVCVCVCVLSVHSRCRMGCCTERRNVAGKDSALNAEVFAVLFSASTLVVDSLGALILCQRLF